MQPGDPIRDTTKFSDNTLNYEPAAIAKHDDFVPVLAGIAGIDADLGNIGTGVGSIYTDMAKAAGTKGTNATYDKVNLIYPDVVSTKDLVAIMNDNVSLIQSDMAKDATVAKRTDLEEGSLVLPGN
jgi:hypothetical protein